MRISEVAEMTGLSISNIRFYEKKGLLTPARNDQSKYRDYSANDIYQLNQIVLYRKIGIPIEKIQLLLYQKISLEQVLKEQSDIVRYLNYVKKVEAKGKKFAEVEELLENFAIYTRFDAFVPPLVMNRLARDVYAVY